MKHFEIFLIKKIRGNFPDKLGRPYNEGPPCSGCRGDCLGDKKRKRKKISPEKRKMLK